METHPLSQRFLQSGQEICPLSYSHVEGPHDDGCLRLSRHRQPCPKQRASRCLGFEMTDIVTYKPICCHDRAIHFILDPSKCCAGTPVNAQCANRIVKVVQEAHLTVVLPTEVEGVERVHANEKRWVADLRGAIASTGKQSQYWHWQPADTSNEKDPYPVSLKSPKYASLTLVRCNQIVSQTTSTNPCWNKLCPTTRTSYHQDQDIWNSHSLHTKNIAQTSCEQMTSPLASHFAIVQYVHGTVQYQNPQGSVA